MFPVPGTHLNITVLWLTFPSYPRLLPAQHWLLGQKAFFPRISQWTSPESTEVKGTLSFLCTVLKLNS